MDTCISTASYSLTPILCGQTPEVISVDAQGRLWVVLERPAGPEASTSPGAWWRVVQLRQGLVELDVEVHCPSDALSEVDALGDGFLLAWSRADGTCTDSEACAWPPNAWVYTRDGHLQRSMTLGDGIEELGVALDGTIWTSHFDEGVYSGFLGIAPLVAWQPSGEWRFNSADRGWTGGDDDLNGLNTGAPGEVWFFDLCLLCRIQGTEGFSAWNLGGHSGPVVAVHGTDVLVPGTWGPPLASSELLPGIGGEDAPGDAEWMAIMMRGRGRAVTGAGEAAEAVPGLQLHWLSLGDAGAVRWRGSFTLCTPDGRGIEATRVIGQGDRLVVIEGDQVHEVSLPELIAGR